MVELVVKPYLWNCRYKSKKIQHSSYLNLIIISILLSSQYAISPTTKQHTTWSAISKANRLTSFSYKPVVFSHSFIGCDERINTPAKLSRSERRITHYTSESSLLSPVVEQEGDVFQEQVGKLRRHSVTNAHSDIQLLSVTSRMYSGMGDSCETVDITRAHL